jgi:nucleoside phosphorylase
MRVLVTFAVDAEFAPWRKLRALKQRTVEGLDFFHTEIGRAQVDFIVTGMGAENAARGSRIGLAEPRTICIGAGFAGSLKEGLKVGDVLAARAVQRLGKAETLECSRNLLTAAQHNKAMAAKMFLTTDHVISTAEEKRQLSPFAEAVDMESFATVEAAREKDVSVIAIRVISDRFDEDMPANIDTTVDEKGHVKVRGVVKHIASHPLQIPALIRLGRQSKTAAEALAHFLEAYIKELSFREHGWPPPELSEVAAR